MFNDRLELVERPSYKYLQVCIISEFFIETIITDEKCTV